MKLEHNKDLRKVSWLSISYCSSGMVKNYYQPETVKELVYIVTQLAKANQQYLIVGHTSNMYFMPDYVCENMVSTKILTNYKIADNVLICDCGVKVSSLAKDMVNHGYKGFEGLVDLPGTIGGALYGNAGCYDCLVSDNLIKVKLLSNTGEILTLSKDDMKFTTRASVLKRKELNATILKAYFRLEAGDVVLLKKIASKNHEIRKRTQPGPAHNLGSVYANENPTLLFYVLRVISHFYGFFVKSNDSRDVQRARKNFELKMMGVSQLVDYVDSWNRFIWKDEKAHELFWKYDQIHSLLFKNSHFEIQIFK